MISSTVRYRHSTEPVTTDGRDVNLSIAELQGEAGGQRSSGSTDKHIGEVASTWQQLPEPDLADPTYYDRPLLKEPVWEWAIPLYYYVGGLTGSALLVAGVGQLRSQHLLGGLTRRCQWIGFCGSIASSGLLIYDLGRPTRFLYMLRVFRPTSPMNMGAWILSGAGSFGSGALLLKAQEGWLRTLGTLLTYAAGLFGTGLATYTGVLVANSAIPVWQESRRMLPALFGASALASLGCVFDLMLMAAGERRVINLIGRTGRVAELVIGTVMERHAQQVQHVGLPFKRGRSGFLWRTAEVLTLASLVASFGLQSRRGRIASGLMGTAGSLLLRYTVQHMGTVSAKDPRATFHNQRRPLAW